MRVSERIAIKMWNMEICLIRLLFFLAQTPLKESRSSFEVSVECVYGWLQLTE